MNRTVLHGLLSPLCGMLRRAATGIGALKIAIWPVLVLGGDRARANGQVKAFPYIGVGISWNFIRF